MSKPAIIFHVPEPGAGGLLDTLTDAVMGVLQTLSETGHLPDAVARCVFAEGRGLHLHLLDAAHMLCCRSLQRRWLKPQMIAYDAGRSLP